jgi:serine/threonine protein kinase/WD40 repeat protein
MSVDAQRVESAFLAAVEVADPAERAAVLDRECASDLQLRRRVEALLQAHEAPASILGRPAVTPLPAGVVQLDDGAPPYSETAAMSQLGEPSAVTALDLAFLEPATKPETLGRIGHYEVLEILGRGGFGIVLRALDEALQRIVAVKVLAPQMAARSPARKRFLREARSNAAIRHDNVVQVHEVQEEPLPYLVMEFIPGETLQQLLDRTGPLDVPEVLRIGQQIAEGLAAAHAMGLIHRDVKPANVLLESPQRRVKLTDFGLARAADDATISQSGLVAGTPMYMAPEQAHGGALDHRADLFSLGSVLYVMVTGRPPFRASSTMAILKRVCDGAPRSIREIIPETPLWLCELIDRLHAKDPADRFQTARDVADLLRRYENELATRGDVVAVPVRRKDRKRSPGKWLAAGAAVVVTGLLLLLPGWFSGGEDRGNPPPPERQPPPVTVWQAPVPPTREELARRSSPFDALDRKELAADVVARLFGAADRAPPGLVALLEGSRTRLPGPGRTSWFAQDRDGKWLASAMELEVVLFDASTMTPKKILGPAAGRVYKMAFSPDGKRLAAATWADEESAIVWELATGEVSLKLNHRGHCRSIQFSPDGDRLLTVGDDDIPIIWNAHSGAEEKRLPLQNHPACCDVIFTADGKQVVTHGGDNALFVWDAATWELLRTLDGPDVSFQNPSEWIHLPLAVSRDGQYLAAGSEAGFRVWETATWEPRGSGATAATWLAFAPDGRTLLTGPHNCLAQRWHSVTRWHTESGERIQAPTPLSSRDGWAVYHLSADGKTLYGMRADPPEPAVHVYDADTLEERHFPGHAGPVQAVDVSADGARIASAGSDGTVRLWDVAMRRLVHTIRRPAKGAVAAVFAGDGKTLYCGWHEDGEILAIDVDSGRRHELGVYGPQLQRLAVSPDGTLLAAAGEAGVRLWSLNDGASRGELPESVRAHWAIAFSHDARTLAVGGAESARVFDVASRRVVTPLEFPGTARWLGFRSEGRQLAVASESPGNPLLLFDLSASARPLRLDGSDNAITSGAWRADGGLLAAVGTGDGAVRLWDLSHDPPRQSTVTLFEPGGPAIQALAMTPEGRHVVTANTDGTITVLRLAKPGAMHR